MKLTTKYTKIFSLIALLVIFILQGVWLYNTYQITKNNLRKTVFEKFVFTTNKEVQLRRKEFTAQSSLAEKIYVSENFGINTLERNQFFPIDITNLEFNHFTGYDIKLSRIDSILRAKKYIQGNFIINRICVEGDDSRITESTAPEMIGKLGSALKIKDIPISIDGREYLQLYMLNSEWAIFYKMLSTILLSLLMATIISLMLYWQYKLYRQEKNARQYQKEHTEAVVHNMATPLQTIAVVNQILEENKIDKAKKEKLIQMQKRQIIGLKSQVEEMLTVSRAKKIGITLDKKDIAIENFINEVCTPLNNNRAKDIQIQTHFELAIPTAHIDTKLFSDLLRNLVSNAIKYSGNSVQIDITSIRTDKELKIMVTDNGIGIDPKYQEDIFEKFNRGGASFRRSSAKGFGIGLSFVKLVVEAHKGNITMHSKGTNQGTTFTICIPQ